MAANRKIVLVDDDRTFVESNRELLEACGYDVFTAHDGAAGIELVRQIRPDLVVLDVMMTTDTEGFETARAIAADHALRRTRVMLLTGVANAMHLPFDFEPDAKWLPVARILEKPVTPSMFIAEIEKLLLNQPVQGDKPCPQPPPPASAF